MNKFSATGIVALWDLITNFITETLIFIERTYYFIKLF